MISQSSDSVATLVLGVVTIPANHFDYMLSWYGGMALNGASDEAILDALFLLKEAVDCFLFPKASVKVYLKV